MPQAGVTKEGGWGYQNLGVGGEGEGTQTSEAYCEVRAVTFEFRACSGNWNQLRG